MEDLSWFEFEFELDQVFKDYSYTLSPEDTTPSLNQSYSFHHLHLEQVIAKTTSESPITYTMNPKKNLIDNVSISESQNLHETTFIFHENPLFGGFFTPFTSSLNEVINPMKLKFLPEEMWTDCYISFDTLKKAYFSQKLGVKVRFQHKLWNALQITKEFPNLYQMVGAIWVTDTIFKADMKIFGLLMNLLHPKQSLCVKNGSFPTHGFKEVSENEIDRKQLKFPGVMDNIDRNSVKFFYHEDGAFTFMNNPDLDKCKFKRIL
ncbi:hypothetical protein TRFO_28904 [Tritrichomonas foetus]|uniref:Initiator binding domain-containing protein n=1 Tax=Tritrichomonas foetus TaxID=1144522 RepID=A0A1J4K1M1_9EUKA|nr:hypothetical protein TRFO_28904 [Tritrichomonas foetus]|eukprot:OHT03646.1 hypothetical protein TRFO_28904 [Tritrichomonas foetus]